MGAWRRVLGIDDVLQVVVIERPDHLVDAGLREGYFVPLLLRGPG